MAWSDGLPLIRRELGAVDEERWEILYRANNDLYKSQVFPTRALAEHDQLIERIATHKAGTIRRRPRLGSLLNDYERAA